MHDGIQQPRFMIQLIALLPRAIGSKYTAVPRLSLRHFVRFEYPARSASVCYVNYLYQ